MGFINILSVAAIYRDGIPAWPWWSLFVLACLVVRNRFNGALFGVPGPFLNSISVLPRLWSVYKGSSQIDDLAMHKKYGKVVRVAPHIVSVSDVSQLEQIYGISSTFYKSGFYNPVRFYDEEGLIPDPFVLADKATHTRMKRNASNAYSLKAMVQMEPLVNRVTEQLLEHLDREYATTGTSCDIGKYLHFFAMDAIFTVTFGKSLDFINKGDGKGMCKHLQDGLVYMAVCGQVPWAHQFLKGNPYLAKLLERGGDTLFTEVMQITVNQRESAEKALAEDKEEDAPCTFLETLLRNQAKSAASITDREINVHTFGNITAGGDTTSTALRAILRDLINHPAVAERLLAELREAGITEVPVPYAAAAKLPYLTCVIRESMRLHPSVGLILARGVPAGGTTLGDGKGKQYYIGPAVEVGVNPWIIHRDPEIFPDPDAFRPDRWLDASPEQLTLMNRAWMPFGVGRHTCSGQHISMLEITKLIPTLVLRYRMTWESKAQRISVINHFFTMQSGMRVSLERRASSDEKRVEVGLT